MARTHLHTDGIFERVTTCRQSGLTDRQWCINNGVPQSTFYAWLKRLRDKACYEIPDSLATITKSPLPTKQDVVRVNIIPERENEYILTPSPSTLESKPEYSDITISFQGIHIGIKNSVDPHILADTLKLLRTFLC